MSKQYRWKLSLLSAMVILGLSTSALAQSNLWVTMDQLTEQPFPQLEMVLTVLDINGVPVSGLKASAFQAQEDDKSLALDSVESFKNSDAPLALALVMDTSLSMANKPIEDSQKAAQSLINQLGAQDVMAIIGFSGQVNLDEPFTFSGTETGFTSDKAKLRSVVGSFKAQGGTALYDAIFKAVRLTYRQGLTRRAVIVMTDGQDCGLLENNVCTQPASRLKEDDPIDEANKFNVAIFTVGLGNDIDKNYLQRVALKTGGAYMAAKESSELDRLFRLIFDQMKITYRLRATSQLSPDEQKHNLVVQVNAPTGGGQVTAQFTAIPAQVYIQEVGYQVQNQPRVMADGVELKGLIRLVPKISSKNRLRHVEYIIDELVANAVVSDPWQYDWDTCKLDPAVPHTIRIRATDDTDAVDERTFNVTIVRGDWLSCGVGPLSPAMLLGLGGGLLLLVLIVIVALFVTGRRRQPVPAPVPQAPLSVPPGYSSAPGGYPATAEMARPSMPPRPQPEERGAPATARQQTTTIGQGEGDRRQRIKTEVLEVAPAKLAWLIIEQGPRTGKEFRLGNETNLGRDPQRNEIVLDDSGISNDHAKIKLEKDVFYLWDMASTNGTFVRNEAGEWERIQKQALVDGDRIKVGTTVMVFKQA